MKLQLKLDENQLAPEKCLKIQVENFLPNHFVEESFNWFFIRNFLQNNRRVSIDNKIISKQHGVVPYNMSRARLKSGQNSWRLLHVTVSHKLVPSRVYGIYEVQINPEELEINPCFVRPTEIANIMRQLGAY